MNDELIDETESKYTYTRIKPTTEILKRFILTTWKC